LTKGRVTDTFFGRVKRERKGEKVSGHDSHGALKERERETMPWIIVS